LELAAEGLEEREAGEVMELLRTWWRSWMPPSSLMGA
jgi:hypothetical protein